MNLFSRFRRLVPKAPLRVGTVLYYEDGVADIEEVGGGIARVRGEAAVDDVVFFRDGQIEGPAPSLPVEIITV